MKRFRPLSYGGRSGVISVAAELAQDGMDHRLYTGGDRFLQYRDG